MNFAFGTGGSTHRFLFRVLFGVVRGCPLSCLLFAVLLDPFLRAISALIDDKGDAVTRACADDIGAAVRGVHVLKKCSSFFEAMRWASGLQLGFAKCCVVPSARRFSLHVASLFKDWLGTNISGWRTLKFWFRASTLDSCWVRALIRRHGTFHLPNMLFVFASLLVLALPRLWARSSTIPMLCLSLGMFRNFFKI